MSKNQSFTVFEECKNLLDKIRKEKEEHAIRRLLKKLMRKMRKNFINFGDMQTSSAELVMKLREVKVQKAIELLNLARNLYYKNVDSTKPASLAKAKIQEMQDIHNQLSIQKCIFELCKTTKAELDVLVINPEDRRYTHIRPKPLPSFNLLEEEKSTTAYPLVHLSGSR